MKRADWILIVVILAVTAGIFCWRWANRQEGTQAVVTIDGRETARYDLSEDREEMIETEYGRNHLVISEGAAEVTEADCPDKVCMREGRIRWSGQTIVCLPHRLVISVEGKGEPEIDGLVR